MNATTAKLTQIRALDAALCDGLDAFVRVTVTFQCRRMSTTFINCCTTTTTDAFATFAVDKIVLVEKRFDTQEVR